MALGRTASPEQRPPARLPACGALGQPRPAALDSHGQAPEPTAPTLLPRPARPPQVLCGNRLPGGGLDAQTPVPSCAVYGSSPEWTRAYRQLVADPRTRPIGGRDPLARLPCGTDCYAFPNPRATLR